MKTFKKIACSVLALGLVMGLTACKPKAFEYQKMVDFLEDQDMDDYDDYDDFIRDYSDAIGMGRDIDGIYIHCDGKDAQDVYDVVLNRFGDFPDYDVEESIAFAMHDEGGFGIGYLFTFEDEKEAEKLFKKYPEARKKATEANAKDGKAATEIDDLSKLKTVYEKSLNRTEAVRERRAERIERGKNFKKIILEAREKGIKYNEVKKLEKPLTEREIIDKLGAYDETRGACSSQALAYIANKFGLDVTDYRKGKSCALFGDDSTIRKLTKAGGFVVKKRNGFENAKALLKHVEPGKEYYFTSGDNAAIVRRNGTDFEFLELQDEFKEGNGFWPLTMAALDERFDTKVKTKWNDYLIDIEKIKDSPKFRELLGFFNTRK